MPGNSPPATRDERPSLLLIALDVPYPDDYGGAKDMWSRTKLAGSKANVDILMTYSSEVRKHAFITSAETAFIRKSFFVKRKSFLWTVLAQSPHSVLSRIPSRRELGRIRKWLNPTYDCVVVEGFHCLGTFSAVRPLIRHRRAVLRVLNLEDRYYRHLATQASSFLWRAYYAAEARRFERFLQAYDFHGTFDSLLFISEAEMKEPSFSSHFERRFVPPLLPPNSDDGLPFQDRDNVLLYVANFELADNQNGLQRCYAGFRTILAKHRFRLVVCGRSRDPTFPAWARGDPNVLVRLNVDHQELKNWYSRAKCFIAYTENPSGVKLKVMEALSYGIPVLCNGESVVGSGCEELVTDWTRLSTAALDEVVQRFMLNQAAWERERNRISVHQLTTFNRYAKHYLELLGVATDPAISEVN